MEQKYLAAIQIGSTHISGAIASLSETGQLKVIAVDNEPVSDSVKYGIIQNVKEVENTITKIIDTLNTKIPTRKIARVYVGIDGRTLHSKTIAIEKRFHEEKEIVPRIIEEIIEEARQSEIGTDYDVVDVLEKSFRIDDKEVVNPVGTFGSTIKATLNKVVCAKRLIRSLEKAIPAGIQVSKRVTLQTALADMVLKRDDKMTGSMLVDLGAETTAVSIYKRGVLQYLQTIPAGSANITHDIASIFNIVEDKAESLKLRDKNVPLEIDEKRLKECIDSRSIEIVDNVLAQLKFAGLNRTDIPSGIVLVGQGAKLDQTTDFFRRRNIQYRFGVLADTSVRIADTAIEVYPCLDIIALLYAVAKNNPIDSTEINEENINQGELSFESDDDNTNQYEPDESEEPNEGEDPISPKELFGSLFRRKKNSKKKESEEIDSEEDDEGNEKPKKTKTQNSLVDKLRRQVAEYMNKTDDDDDEYEDID